ncbi:MAG: 50S ribosomal protein L11 methyltransferase [Bacteroidota bacterium]
MDYYIYQINCDAPLRDILIAFLSAHPFDVFEERSDGLTASLPAAADLEEIETTLNDLQQQFDFAYQREFSPAQNWNAVWESNFQPVQVGNFCGIRAEFHDTMPDVQYELVIQPKMSFGTGHHATTFQMVAMMQQIDFQDKTVFDYGCGTGVLAILAAQLGARKVMGIDIEEWAVENSRENATRNGVSHLYFEQNDLTDFNPKGYDIILANITRNVISSSLQSLYTHSSDSSLLLTSGFFVEDVEGLIQQAKTVGWQFVRQSEKDNWACVLFRK